jgi:hypothetical protein
VNENFAKGIYPKIYDVKYLNMLICDRCWEEYSLEELKKCNATWDKYFWEVDEETSITDRYWEIYEAIDRKIWCSKCVAALKL